MGTPATLPANFNQWDQPNAGAPPTTLPPDFAKWDEKKDDKPSTPAPPAKPEPDNFQRAAHWIDAHLPGGEKTPEEEQQGVMTLGDFAAGTAKSIYDVTPVGMGAEYLKKKQGKPNEFSDIPQKGAQFFAGSLLGSDEPAPARPVERTEAPAVRATSQTAEVPLRNRIAAAADKVSEVAGGKLTPNTPRAIGRFLLKRVPGVNAIRDSAELVRDLVSPEVPPVTKPPAVPEGALARPAAVLPAPRFDVIGANNTERGLLAARGQRPPVTELPPSGRRLSLPSGVQAEVAPAPYRLTRGQVAPDVISRPDSRLLPNNGGVRTTPIALLPETTDAPPVGTSPRLAPPRIELPERFNPRGEQLENKSFEDAAREDLDRHGRLAFKSLRDEFEAGHKMDVPKGEQIQNLRNTLAQPEKLAPGWTRPNSGRLTVGSSAGAEADTAYAQAARQALGAKASVSDVLQLAQKLKSAGIAPGASMEELLRKSVELAGKKKF